MIALIRQFCTTHCQSKQSLYSTSYPAFPITICKASDERVYYNTIFPEKQVFRLQSFLFLHQLSGKLNSVVLTKLFGMISKRGRHSYSIGFSAAIFSNILF